MPDGMRNSSRYKSLIPNMPGTGREREAERLAVLMDWMWTVVLPQIQPVADKGGFGSEWQRMCETKTSDEKLRSAAYAADAAYADAAYAAAAYAADAAYAAAARAAAAADAAAYADAAYAAAYASAAYAADAAFAASAAASAAARSARGTFWETVDPIGVLERMTYLGAKP